MRALVYHGPGEKAWEEVPDPEITDDGDAIVRVDSTTICGTDLHILRGDLPEVRPGRILGHEAVGTVDEVGDGVHRLADEEMLMLADVLPTGYEVGALAGGVRAGDVVAVVGAGPVGLSAIACARLFSPSHVVAIDLSGARLDAAKHSGADVTINDLRDDPVTVIRDLTGRVGADVAIEAVGDPATFELAVRLARPGGRIANIGVHGKPTTLHLEQQWTRDITITTGLVDASSTPTLMRLVATGQLDARRLVTDRLGMDEFGKAYEIFADAASTGALKVVLSADRG